MAERSRYEFRHIATRTIDVKIRFHSDDIHLKETQVGVKVAVLRERELFELKEQLSYLLKNTIEGKVDANDIDFLKTFYKQIDEVINDLG